jgi:hypothetical protein
MSFTKEDVLSKVSMDDGCFIHHGENFFDLDGSDLAKYIEDNLLDEWQVVADHWDTGRYGCVVFALRDNGHSRYFEMSTNGYCREIKYDWYRAIEHASVLRMKFDNEAIVQERLAHIRGEA